MDLGIVAAVLMLVAWGVRTFLFTAPGWWHALLTFGVFLLVWRIVVRGTPSPDAGTAPRAGAAAARGRDRKRTASR
ncbi:MAG TPA: hypothetical protein VGE02_15210 [Gemmatimonadales bacterium]